jgi:hypothetical protein
MRHAHSRRVLFIHFMNEQRQRGSIADDFG